MPDLHTGFCHHAFVSRLCMVREARERIHSASVHTPHEESLALALPTLVQAKLLMAQILHMLHRLVSRGATKAVVFHARTELALQICRPSTAPLTHGYLRSQACSSLRPPLTTPPSQVSPNCAPTLSQISMHAQHTCMLTAECGRSQLWCRCSWRHTQGSVRTWGSFSVMPCFCWQARAAP